MNLEEIALVVSYGLGYGMIFLIPSNLISAAETFILRKNGMKLEDIENKLIKIKYKNKLLDKSKKLGYYLTIPGRAIGHFSYSVSHKFKK